MLYLCGVCVVCFSKCSAEVRMSVVCFVLCGVCVVCRVCVVYVCVVCCV